MLRRQVSVLLGFLLLAGGLGYGLVQLFNLRMASGDAFPRYSTLRADPLGTKVLLDSLNGIPNVSAWRNYRPLPQLKTSGPITLVYAGLPYQARWEEKELRFFETLIRGGSRAVFAFHPQRPHDPAWNSVGSSEVNKEQKKKRKKGDKKAAEKGKEQEAEEGETKRKKTRLETMIELQQGLAFEKVAREWGFRFEVLQHHRSETPPDWIATGKPDAAGLEPSVPWRSALYFADVKPPWKTLYTLEGNPVLIERPWGQGSIILASDSYFLSNEAVHGQDRAPKLLTRLLGSPRTIIFDEEHLGVSEQSGVATLAKKYRLHGLVAGLFLIAALFLWQNVVRFVPPQTQAVEADALVTGRGSSEGFIALLRRSIPTSQLLDTCVAEWRRTFGHDTRAIERLNATRPAQPPRRGADIVAAYQSMTQAVAAGKVSSNQKPVISEPAAPAAPERLALPN